MQTQLDDNQPLQKEAIIEETPTELLANLESTIKEHVVTISKSKSELKKLREMLSDMFINDATYQEHDKAAKDSAKIRAKTKSELLKQPTAADLHKKIQEMSSEQRDSQAALSDYLREYQRLSGSNEIESDDGEVLEIVYVAKLVKRTHSL